MRKQVLSFVAVAAFVVATLSSCATINSGAAISSNAPIGQKIGEASSNIYFGLWSSQGEQNNLKEAAKNGGITNVKQVEYIDKSMFLGLIIKHTTRVYGD